MVKITVVVNTPVGLHARPASLFVKTASRFESAITVIKDDKEVNGKALLALMSLAARLNDEITITADGKDEKEAIEALAKLFRDNFAED